MSVKLNYRCAERVIEVDDTDRTILDISIANGVPLWRECGGRARCTTCRVRILDGLGNVAPRTRAEDKLAKLRGWDPSTRLACQTRVTGDITLERLIRGGADVSPLQLETIRAGTGEERDLAILFCDVRDFTPFVESHLSYDVVHILNQLFTSLGEPILLNNGVIYQYVGDEITGLFGLEENDAEQTCRAAVRAGLGMLDALESLNDLIEKEFGARFQVGIGVHYGPVIIGQIGHPSHQQFGVIGDTVNVASRIETMNKTLGTRFLVSGPVVANLPPDTLVTGQCTSTVLKGKQQASTLFEITGFTEPDSTLLVQQTIGAVLSDTDRFTEIFYRRLFACAPHMRAMFPDDMTAQANKLAQMLETLAYAVGRPAQFALGLENLGKRHIDYGIEAVHYEAFVQPFLETIEEVLGQACKPDVAEAWQAFIDNILHLMQSGAKARKKNGAS